MTTEWNRMSPAERALHRAVAKAEWQAEQANIKAALVLIERDALRQTAEYLRRVTPQEVEAVANRLRRVELETA
jgi:hypothetical protein